MSLSRSSARCYSCDVTRFAESAQPRTCLSVAGFQATLAIPTMHAPKKKIRRSTVVEPPADISTHTTFTKTSFSYKWSINHFSTISQVSGITITSPAFTSGCDDIKWRLDLRTDQRQPDSPSTPPSQVSAVLVCLGREPGTDVPPRLVPRHGKTKLAQPVIVDYTLSALKNGSRLKSRKCSPVMMPSSGMKARIDPFLKDVEDYLDDKGNLTVLCKINVVHHCEPTHNTSDTTSSPKSSIKVTKIMEKVFYHERHYADVILVAEKHEFKVHKHMLSACSDVFKSMFDQPMQESASNRVEIADVKANTLQAMVKFIYTGEMINCELVADLTTVADKYNIQPLKAVCVRELSRSLDVRNAVSTLLLAELYCIEGLREECVAFVANNMGTVKRATPEDWQELKTEHAQLMFEVFDVHADIS